MGMKVLVTGTSGLVGSHTARELLAHGHSVRGFDRNGPPDDLRGRIDVFFGDLKNRFDLLRAAEGCDAVAHLAAITHPHGGEEDIFPTNVTGTQWVLDAAEASGIRRVALASTCCAFGIFFARHPIAPQYLPIDEAHPALPQDMYGLSKLLNEETAAAYTRRCGMTTVALRLTSVFRLEQVEHPERWRRWLEEDEGYHRDLWTYIDVRDCARAFRLALENAAEGTHTTAIIAARDSATARDIRELVARHLPERAADIAHLAPTDSLYVTARAEEAFGFVAKHTWRNVPGLSG